MGSMGFGAVGGVLQSKLIKKKTEEQRVLLKEAIASDIPIIVNRAIENSEDKIISLYNSILRESSKRRNSGKKLKCLQ